MRKGVHGIRIAARLAPKKAGDTEQTEPQRHTRPVRFTTVWIFGLSQTDPLPGVEQLMPVIARAFLDFRRSTRAGHG